jgi:DNA-binding MarR family transcriptional regulator
LRKASRRMSQFYDSELTASGLKSTQFSILAEIERRNGAPPTLGELAEALVMDQSTIGQNLRPLERDGLISLQADPSDRRRRYVALTETGRARIALGRPLWAGAQKRFEKFFGTEEAAELRAALLNIAHELTPNGDDDRGAEPAIK